MARLNINGRSYTLIADLTGLITTGGAHLDLRATHYGQEIWISHGTVITTSH